MICPKCKTKITESKKHKLINCECGSTLMIVEINKIKQIVDLSKKKAIR